MLLTNTTDVKPSDRYILLSGCSGGGDPLYVVYDMVQRIATNHRIFDKPDGLETVNCLNRLNSIPLEKRKP